jgi:thiol-disulfide isomerase/thioredoxin
MLCLNFSSYSQGRSTPIKPLAIGDKMPDVEIRNILNSKNKTAKIGDYKGKVIILDFWSTWCSSCIEGFPKLDSLQRQFSGDLKVFLVNSKKEGDTQRGVNMVISRMQAWSAQPFKLAVVLKDTSITQYFNFQSLPHCVWIGPDGSIVGITDKKEITAENIKKIITGKPFHLIPKTL